MAIKIIKKTTIATISIFSLFILNNANATNLSVGTGIIYANINDPKLKYVKELEFNPMLNVGLSDNYNRIFYGINTNRILNQSSTRAVIDNNKNTYHLKSKVIIDTVTIGYASKISPFIFAGNLINKKELLLNNSRIKQDQESAIIWGGGLSKRIKQHTINLHLIAPCQAVKSEYAVGLSYSYNFKLN